MRIETKAVWPCTMVILISGLLGACGTTKDVPIADPSFANGNQLGAIEYVVQTGDNLELIASDITRQRENWRRIADFNQIDNPASLKVGQKILIPKDLIPLTVNEDGTRSVAGHPDAVVNSVKLPTRIKPIN